LPAGRPREPKDRWWRPTPDNDDFIENLYSANPQDFNLNAFVNGLVTMARVGAKGSLLDALTMTRKTNTREPERND
jgi:hypothetical protein